MFICVTLNTGTNVILSFTACCYQGGVKMEQINVNPVASP